MCQPCHTLCSPTNTKDDDDDASYLDTFNDLPWSCSIGTSDEHGIWLNRADPAGTCMAFSVWILLSYSILTMTLLATTSGIPPLLAMTYTVVACLALASHVKTTLTDPGAVPTSAVPTAAQRRQHSKLSMCSQCQTFKPPMSHHCRICNRCISRMDHHCPWMNNCIGASKSSSEEIFFLPIMRLTPISSFHEFSPHSQFEAFHFISHLHLDLFRLFATALWLELLFLRRRTLRLQRCLDSTSATHDRLIHWRLFIYQ